MTVEEMCRRKKELGYTYEQISKLSGVPLGTVQKIFGGITVSPRYETLQALEKVFRKKETGNVTYDFNRNLDGKVGESVPAYTVSQRNKKQGEYTLEDYYALPQEHRAELIDGVFYDMASPLLVHQALGGEIYSSLKSFIKEKKGSCIALMAPVDVQLDCDDKTMVQPDVLVLCDREKLFRGCINGAPDMVIEVLSQSTRKKDMYLKLKKYTIAGVREYWIVDPEMQKVVVYDLEHDALPAVYGFDTRIPVGIFNRECEIDFAEIYDYIQFLYEKEGLT